ncbi:MAG TPA: hypothetical protein VMU89_09805 [Thermomicrobiaceae bacterium]|nr:hypothetical protein [Thermomicrobiaceae bacterium]
MAFGMVAAGSWAPIVAQASPPNAFGELDCNGYSTIQKSIRGTMNCTDVRGLAGVDNANTWGGRFYDNNNYIGHDEPDMSFYSSLPGSGNNVSWSETLPRDPSLLPTVRKPGYDVTHWFELSVAPWFSMVMCDPNSYPQASCTANSDTNTPNSGMAFMEMQFYPPGFAPFADAISCDNTHWCAAMTIDSLECTLGFASCNPGCTEPVNFAFIQTNGVPAGPPSPQLSNLATFTPNGSTLLMNPGDKLTVQMSDQPVPGGGGAMAFEVAIKDLTTGQSGLMQASAANGFMNTSIADCSGTAFNFQPAYSTASPGNIAGWTALQTNISTQYEIGHFEACSSLSQPGTVPLAPGVNDVTYNQCSGPYEASAPADATATSPEYGDAFCYPFGDTHGVLNSTPDLVTGCMDNVFQNGDLDFDGSSYWADWPTGTSPSLYYPSTFQQSPPLSSGHQYAQFSFQTDLALSESTCTGTAGCSVPPPNAPGHFYPYFGLANTWGHCQIEFGNVAATGALTFGQAAQYGTNQYSQIGYPEFESQLYSNICHP